MELLMNSSKYPMKKNLIECQIDHPAYAEQWQKVSELYCEKSASYWYLISERSELKKLATSLENYGGQPSPALKIKYIAIDG